MDPTKVFDISRPNQVSPGSTSRPVIVGHQPQMADPMVNRPAPQPQSAPAAPAISAHPTHTIVTVSDGTPAPAATPTHHQVKVIAVSDDIKNEIASALPPADPLPETPAKSETMPPLADNPGLPAAVDTSAAPINTDTATPVAPAGPAAPAAQAEIHHQSLPLGHAPAASRRRNLALWLFVAVFLVAFGFYLAIDAGIINTNINLPFHIFNRQI